MACGPSEGLAKLGAAVEEAKAAVDNAIADAEAGIAGAINDLNATLESAVGGVTAKMKEAMPKVELPSLEFELPEIKLPEIKLPEKLTDAMGEVLSFANDPLGALGVGDNPLGDVLNNVPGSLEAFGNEIGGKLGITNKSLDAQLESISKKFGVDVSKYKDQILNGELTLENLCKQVENVELNEDGTTVQKGTPATAPSEDAETPPPAADKAVFEIVQAIETIDPDEAFAKVEEAVAELDIVKTVSEIPDDAVSKLFKDSPVENVAPTDEGWLAYNPELDATKTFETLDEAATFTKKSAVDAAKDLGFEEVFKDYLQ